jgi:ribosomal-protein-alanine N-acetyltransferase
MPILRTPRLVLLPFTEDDYADLLALNSDPEVRPLIFGDGTAEETRAELGRTLAAASDPPCGGWVLRIEGDRTFMGRVNIKRNIETGEHELLYALHKAFWGQGYASEAAAAVLGYAHTAGCTSIMACAAPENAGSIAVMKKIGMHYVGRERMYGRESVVYRSKRADSWVDS